MRIGIQPAVLWAFLTSVCPAFAAIRTFDDRDPLIQRNGGWVDRGVDVEYGGTTSESRTPGDSITFRFIGTQVAVFGTLGPVGNYTTKSTYAINEGSPQLFTSPFETSRVQRNIRFYMSEELPNANHILTIVNQGDWFYLDYLEVTVPDSIVSTKISTSAEKPSPTPQISSSSLPPDTLPATPTPVQPSQETRLTPSSSLLVPSSSSLSERQTVVLSTSITTWLTPESPRSSSAPSSLSTEDSPQSSTSPDQSVKPTRAGLSKGVIAGIAITSALALFGCLVLLYFCSKRRRAYAEVDSSTAPTASSRYSQRRGFPSTIPASTRTSSQTGANVASSEPDYPFGSATASTSADPMVPMSQNRHFPPPSDMFSIVPQAESTCGPDVIPNDNLWQKPVSEKKLYGSAATSESRNAMEDIHSGPLPPVYTPY